MQRATEEACILRAVTSNLDHNPQLCLEAARILRAVTTNEDGETAWEAITRVAYLQILGLRLSSISFHVRTPHSLHLLIDQSVP